MGHPHPASLYPAFLDLRGLRVVVVGGGAVAARKARSLLKSGAQVIAVAKEFGAAFRAIPGCELRRRAVRASDLRGARLVFAATNSPKLNARLAESARQSGAWVNAASPPEAGNLQVPASVRRGRLCLAISTSGVSAAAAKALRREISGRLAPAWATFLALLESRRRRIRHLVPDAQLRRRLLASLGSLEWMEYIRRRGRAAAAKAMDARIAGACSRTRRTRGK